MKRGRNQLVVVLLILLSALAGMSSLARPRLVPATAPETDFSAERAMVHVSAISQAPHPPGSEEIERVRNYILAELAGLGLDAEIQETTVVVGETAVTATSIQNIIAKIPGTSSSKAILLDAHYDTRAMTPGASDCGSCVATVLETAHALLAGPQLQNDVVLLFTDNEEYGAGLGAAAFVKEHPWAEDIGLVLNFEGLGSTGPAILFETGPNSGWAVQDWGQVSSHPVGQSWFQEIYSRTPIGTDLNWFSEKGIPGMNFGHWANGTVYHTMLDNPQTIDQRSLQHHGSNALALTQYFGNQDLNEAQNSGSNSVYFTLFPGTIVSYPTTWAIPLAALVGLLLIGVAFFGIRTKQITVRGMLKGLGGFFLSLIVTSGLATGLWMGASQLHSEYLAMLTFRGMFYNAHFYVYAFAALAVAVAAAILVWLRRKTATMDLLVGALLLFWLMSLSTSILAPGFSYLFTWPLVFSTLAFGWAVWSTAQDKDTSQIVIAMTIGALPGVFIFAPSIYVMFHFALAPMIGILAFMIALLLGLLIPPINLLTHTHKWRLSGVALAICAGFLITGSLTASFNANQPRPNAVAYLLDSDSGEANWFSAGFLQDDWTQQFFTTKPEHGAVGDLFPIAQRNGFPIMQGIAPKAALAAPIAEILNDQTTNGVRSLQLNVSSPRGAEVMMVDVEPYTAVTAATINNTRIETAASERNLWSLTYYAVPEDGFELTLELNPATPATLQICDQTWELLPEVVAQSETPILPRTESMMPMPNFDYGTVVVATLHLD